MTKVLVRITTGLVHAARGIRFFGHLACLIAGIALVTLGPPFVGTYWFMGNFLLIGGLFCITGALTDRWLGELLGLPLSASALMSFAVATYKDTWEAVHWIALPSIAILASFAILLIARWVDLFVLARVIDRVHRRVIQERIKKSP